MRKLRVKLLAYSGASEDVYQQGREKFLYLIEQAKIEFVEDQPDILFAAPR